MNIKTFVILAGNTACNARCPYCVSRMLPAQTKEPKINWRNFQKACELAKKGGAAKCLITSHGEATIFPDQITKYLKNLKDFSFPIIELQTNGILIFEQLNKFEPYLKQWYDLGMTTVAISVVSDKAEENRKIYTPYKNNYINLDLLIKLLHDVGFSVRLACTLIKNYIDNHKKLEGFINFCRKNFIEQITIRPVSIPKNLAKNCGQETTKWVFSHKLSNKAIADIKNYLNQKGTSIMKYSDGVEVFDISGQNLCWASPNWTKLDPESEDIRQLIFFPDGHLRYDWRYKGSIIL